MAADRVWALYPALVNRTRVAPVPALRASIRSAAEWAALTNSQTPGRDLARRLSSRTPLDEGGSAMTEVSYAAESIRDSVLRMEDAILAAAAPHVRMRPTVAPDGNKWCCLYGENLMEGVAGFGDTPQQACWDFDRAWHNERTPAAIRIEAGTGGTVKHGPTRSARAGAEGIAQRHD